MRPACERRPTCVCRVPRRMCPEHCVLVPGPLPGLCGDLWCWARANIPVLQRCRAAPQARACGLYVRMRTGGQKISSSSGQQWTQRNSQAPPLHRGPAVCRLGNTSQKHSSSGAAPRAGACRQTDSNEAVLEAILAMPCHVLRACAASAELVSITASVVSTKLSARQLPLWLLWLAECYTLHIKAGAAHSMTVARALSSRSMSSAADCSCRPVHSPPSVLLLAGGSGHGQNSVGLPAPWTAVSGSRLGARRPALCARLSS